MQFALERRTRFLLAVVTSVSIIALSFPALNRAAVMEFVTGGGGAEVPHPPASDTHMALSDVLPSSDPLHALHTLVLEPREPATWLPAWTPNNNASAWTGVSSIGVNDGFTRTYNFDSAHASSAGGHEGVGRARAGTVAFNGHAIVSETFGGMGAFDMAGPSGASFVPGTNQFTTQADQALGPTGSATDDGTLPATNAAPVGLPEPDSRLLLGLALLSLGAMSWRRKRAAKTY